MICDLAIFFTLTVEHRRRNLSATDVAWIILVESIQQLGHAFGVVLHVSVMDGVVVDISHRKVQLVASDFSSHHRGEEAWRTRGIKRSRVILAKGHRMADGEVLQRREDWTCVSHRRKTVYGALGPRRGPRYLRSQINVQAKQLGLSLEDLDRALGSLGMGGRLRGPGSLRAHIVTLLCRGTSIHIRKRSCPGPA